MAFRPRLSRPSRKCLPLLVTCAEPEQARTGAGWRVAQQSTVGAAPVDPHASGHHTGGRERGDASQMPAPVNDRVLGSV